jgi:hypothetical protein
VENDQITAFTLYLRTYGVSGQQQIVLPPVQAAAAMSALELDGRELLVLYQDQHEERTVPIWTAVSGRGE